MKFEYQPNNGEVCVDDAITSVVAYNGTIMVNSENGLKYSIVKGYVKRYEENSSFFHIVPIASWKVKP